MALSAFDDRENHPRDPELEAVLGPAAGMWRTLVEHAASEFPPLEEVWVFSGKQWGWALRLKQKKRAIVYLTPREGYFIAGFALGEKAVKAAHETGLGAELLETIDSAQKYAEGRAVRLEVRTDADLEGVKQVATIKMAN